MGHVGVSGVGREKPGGVATPPRSPPHPPGTLHLLPAMVMSVTMVISLGCFEDHIEKETSKSIEKLQVLFKQNVSGRETLFRALLFFHNDCNSYRLEVTERT